jgi:hypothetical protein
MTSLSSVVSSCRSDMTMARMGNDRSGLSLSLLRSSNIILLIEIILVTLRMSCSSIEVRHCGSAVEGNASCRWVLMCAMMSAANLRWVKISSVRLSMRRNEGSIPRRRKWIDCPLSLTCGIVNRQWLNMALGSSTLSAFSVLNSWKSLLFSW